MNSKKTFYLIDGSSYIYRAFYALPRLTGPRGMPTQAVNGFARILRKVLREKEPDYVCVVFDAPGPNFRHSLYEAYKATRQKMPEDMAVQIPYIKDLVRCWGIPQLEVAGYEADDLIAALTRTAREKGVDVTIVSGDKDLLQLVRDPSVRQWDPQKDKVYEEKTVEERFGVQPAHMRDYLSLVGDSTDNVPGVKGVGDKTARQLLERWKTLDNLYAHLEEVSRESLRKTLGEHKEEAYLSWELVALKSDAPVEEDLSRYTPSPVLGPRLRRLYEELGLRKLLEELPQEEADEAPASTEAVEKPPWEDRRVTSIEELHRLVERLRGEESFSFSLDVAPSNPMRADLRGIAFCREDRVSYYVPLAEKDAGDGSGIPLQAVLDEIRELFGRSTPVKIGADLKSSWIILRRYGVELSGMDLDPTVANYLLDPGAQGHSLDRLVQEHLGETISGGNESRNTEGPAPPSSSRNAPAASRDAVLCRRLAPVLRRKLEETGLYPLYRTLEFPLIRVLADMEYRGIRVDSRRLEDLSLELEKAMDQRAGVIFQLAGCSFNIQSPKQLSHILFDKLNLRVLKKTKTGPSTDVRVLEELAGDHPIVEQVLAFRSLAKLRGTYAESLPRLVHPETGRIHTSYNQTVAATGRLSSSDPNLQNIPIRSEEGRKIREAFVPSTGSLLLSADYSQIELRILAHYSRDEHLTEAFRTGEDVHQRTAMELFGVAADQVLPEMRRRAKTVNFGIIYGMGPFGLAQRLRIPNPEAKKIIEQYFRRYEGVRKFIDDCVEQARLRGYSETLLGRRRPIPELQSRNQNMRQLGARLAINTPVQGTAADLIKKAMIDLFQALEGRKMKTAMLLQVHDELVFEVPRGELEEAKELIREGMEKVWELAVPLRVDMGWGTNWAEAHP
ncbi:MAG TPA: DNA polymerase I [Syntrophobacteraceae bacterium]|nr:DNA polymerase I [Syntrophobacteraceae bacterium]